MVDQTLDYLKTHNDYSQNYNPNINEPTSSIPTAEGAFGKQPTQTAEGAFGKKPDSNTPNDYSRLPFDEQSPGLIDPTNTIKDIHQEFLKKGPYSGPVSDQLFQQGSVGRIMAAFGQKANESWGTDDSSIYKAEIDTEAKQKDISLLTAFRNAVMKPTAVALDTIIKSGIALGAGAGGALGQTSEELEAKADELRQDPTNQALTFNAFGKPISPAYPLDYASEILQGYASGGGLEGGLLGHTAGLDHMQQISDARSKGIIGPDGEAGWAGLVKPTPEELQARESAAQDAGEWVPKFQKGAFTSIEDHVPTTPELARQMDPDTFKKLDDLGDLKENLQNSISNELTKRQIDLDNGVSEDHPRLKQQAEDISELQERLQKADEGLRDLIPDRADAEARANELLDSQSPEGDAYRNLVQAQAFERALQAEPLKAKAEETLRLANDMKEASELDKPIKTESTQSTTSPNQSEKTPQVKTPQVKLAPESTGGSLRRLEGTGEKTPLSTNQRLQLDAVIKGWKDEVGDVPQEAVLKNEQQFGDALRIAQESPGLAEKYATGEAEVPSDVNVHPEAFLRVMKQIAEDTDDHELGLRLADTNLAVEHRTMGQRIQLLSGLHDIDPVGIIQDLNKGLADAGKKAIMRMSKEIKASIDDALRDFKPDIEKFLKNIQCDE